MRKGRLAAMIAAPLAVAMMATACGGSSEDDQAVTVEWGEPQSPLVPGNTTEVNGSNVLDTIFSGLVKYDSKTNKPVNEMAQSIKSAPDNKHFTIKIKPGWTFHNGEPVTAHSFVDAWNYTAYGPNGQQGSSFFEPIQGYSDVQAEHPKTKTMSGLKVIDDTTFEVTLSKPNVIFPVMLGYTAFYPLPKAFFRDKEGFENHPIGNGPFKFDNRVPNQSLTVTKYDKFKGPDKPKIQKAEFKVYDNLDTAYQDLVSGDLDFLRQMPTSALTEGQWKEDLGDGAIRKPGLLTQAVSFPMYNPKFRDPDFRKAISMSINRESIVKNIFSDSMRPADGWATPAVDGYVPNQCGEACEFNPKKARELLKKAGGFKGTLPLETNEDGGHREWAQAVVASIKQNLGINVVYKPTPTFSEFRQKIEDRSMDGLFRAGWVADYPNIETFLTQLYRTDGSSNDGEYSNPAFDKALDYANAAPSIPEANKRYAEAERLLANDIPNIPLWSEDVLAGRSDRLATGDVTAFRKLDLTTVTLEK